MQVPLFLSLDLLVQNVCVLVYEYGGGKGVCSEHVQGVLVSHYKLMEEKHACELVVKVRPRKRSGSISHHLHPQSFAAVAAGELLSNAVPCMLPGTKAASERLCASLQAGALLPLCGAPMTYFSIPRFGLRVGRRLAMLLHCLPPPPSAA